MSAPAGELLAVDGGQPLRATPMPGWPVFAADEIAAVRQVLAAGRVNYWTGEIGRWFEADYAALTGRRHAIAVANGTLALELALQLRDLGKCPGALAVISPVTDPSLSGDTVRANAAVDPMLRRGWIEQGLRGYGGADTPLLERNLRGLPPTLIQVGEQEILLSDATRFAQRAAAQGVDVRLERHEARWHVFHLQSFYLQTAVDALQTMAAFCRTQTAAGGTGRSTSRSLPRVARSKRDGFVRSGPPA
jgi:hypothetical protein